jgi:hypothetical protein
VFVMRESWRTVDHLNGYLMAPISISGAIFLAWKEGVNVSIAPFAIVERCSLWRWAIIPMIPIIPTPQKEAKTFVNTSCLDREEDDAESVGCGMGEVAGGKVQNGVNFGLVDEATGLKLEISLVGASVGVAVGASLPGAAVVLTASVISTGSLVNIISFADATRSLHCSSMV